jgi:hypothetical protein
MIITFLSLCFLCVCDLIVEYICFLCFLLYVKVKYVYMNSSKPDAPFHIFLIILARITLGFILDRFPGGLVSYLCYLYYNYI